jgi:hypothetical protein
VCVCVCVYIYIYITRHIKLSILTIKKNTSGIRSGYGIISTPVHSLIDSKFSILIGLLKHGIEMTYFLILRFAEP